LREHERRELELERKELEIKEREARRANRVDSGLEWTDPNARYGNDSGQYPGEILPLPESALRVEGRNNNYPEGRNNNYPEGRNNNGNYPPGPSTAYLQASPLHSDNGVGGGSSAIGRMLRPGMQRESQREHTRDSVNEHSINEHSTDFADLDDNQKVAARSKLFSNSKSGGGGSQKGASSQKEREKPSPETQPIDDPFHVVESVGASVDPSPEMHPATEPGGNSNRSSNRSLSLDGGDGNGINRESDGNYGNRESDGNYGNRESDGKYGNIDSNTNRNLDDNDYANRNDTISSPTSTFPAALDPNRRLPTPPERMDLNYGRERSRLPTPPERHDLHVEEHR
jgi:hypothetical protein